MDIAILYGYNGREFSGGNLNETNSVEGRVIQAFSTLLPLNVDLQSVARAAPTEEGEHAHKQVLSFSICYNL
jgi:tRNA U38,U39,U40 pseudouridine synthase TruA